jgi:hypothetical protein
LAILGLSNGVPSAITFDAEFVNPPRTESYDIRA